MVDMAVRQIEPHSWIGMTQIDIHVSRAMPYRIYVRSVCFLSGDMLTDVISAEDPDLTFKYDYS